MFAYIGSFTSQRRKAHGKGISVYKIDQVSGAWTLVQVFETVPNPGFLALDQQCRFLYSSHGDGAEICAYSIDKPTGRIELLNKQPTDGDNGAHVTVDPTNRYVVLANGPGMAVYPINKDGSLAPFSDIVVPPGEVLPPHRKKPSKSHPHQVHFDPSGRFLMVPDHGIDKVHVCRLDVSNGKFVANVPPFVKSRDGAAPRHIIFHPTKPLAYVLNELASTVTTYRWDSERGVLEPFQELATAPTTYTDDNKPSEIAITPSGNFFYVSNRGHDSIAIFRVDQNTGALDTIGWEPTQGKRPRFFTLDPAGKFLYAANEISNTIVIFNVDAQSGKLTPTGQIVETGTPTCILFAD